MLARLLSLLLASLLCVGLPASAVTPLTPHLTDTARAELSGKLAQINFPEVGQSSVLLTLGDALRFAPADAKVVYELPYPQLPHIDATAVIYGADCSKVTLIATYPHRNPAYAMTLRGTYCLCGPARWRAVEQVVERDR